MHLRFPCHSFCVVVWLAVEVSCAVGITPVVSPGLRRGFKEVSGDGELPHLGAMHISDKPTNPAD